MRFRPKKEIVSFFQEVFTPTEISIVTSDKVVESDDIIVDVSNSCVVYCFHHIKETNKIEMRYFPTVTELIESMK